MDQEKIGKYIAECRKQQKLTQEQLAEKLGVTSKSISRWENGKTMPDVSLFEPLCKELNISFNDLLSGETTDKDDCSISAEELEKYKELIKNQEKGGIVNMLGKIFKERENQKPNSLQAKYNRGISNLLLVVAFSVVNIVLLLLNTDTYFLFSAFIPYFLVDYAMFFCGLYPEEYYYDIPEIEFADKSLMAVAVAIAVVIVLIYLLCWCFAKKKKLGALILALVCFTADTVAMLLITGLSIDMLLDIIFHIWVISCLVIAASTYSKMKNAPETDVEGGENTDENIAQENSEMLRMAANVKCRVFLEAEFEDMHIVYRRVKHTNELIVNGCVYDEYNASIEFAHTLAALVNGRRIEASFDGKASVRLAVDSQEIAKKIRLF